MLGSALIGARTYKMSNKVTVSGANLSYVVTWSGPTAKLGSVLDYAVNELYNRGVRATDTPEVAYSQLTNAQKGDILEAYLKNVTQTMAQAYYINQQMQAAQETATTTAGTTIVI